MDDYPPPKAPPPLDYDFPEDEKAPPRKPRGCLFYGCVTAAVASVMMVVAVGCLIYFGSRFLINKAKEYTDTAPMPIPPVEMAEEDRAALKGRTEEFRKAVNAGEPTRPLVLDADDINALIDADPDMKGKAHIEIEGDTIHGQLSLPLKGLGIGALENRFLNGEATFRVSLRDGVLVVMADEVKVKGRPLPEEMMASLRAKNLAEDALKDPENREALSKLESVEVKDGKVIITPRVAPEAGGDEPKAEPKEDAKAEPKEDARPEPDDATAKPEAR